MHTPDNGQRPRRDPLRQRVILVSSCAECNQRKRGRTLSEAGMHLLDVIA